MSDQPADAASESDGGWFPIPVSETGLKFLFYGGLLLYVGSHVALAREWSWENKLFPFLVGIPLLSLIMVNMVLIRYPSIRGRLTPDTYSRDRMSEALSSSSDVVRSRAERHKAELKIVAWTVALPGAVYLLGFAYSLPPYVFVFTLYHTRDLKKAATGTLLFTVFSYLVFLVMLNLRMYHGVIGLPNILDYIPT